MTEGIESRLRQVANRIKAAAIGCGRDPRTVKLVAVSKTVSPDRMLAAIRAGVTEFGENYVQEAQKKMEALQGHGVSWHFIGRLQTNKAKYAVRLFDLIHSVDSIKLATELNRRSHNLGKVQNILVQVNISGEATKSGIETDLAMDLVGKIARFENLAIRGLMTLPPYFNEPEKARPYFRALKGLKDLIGQQRFPGADMAELSMGMSGDFETAIQEGATLVRIGTAIFGERT
jgi:pyridoxal phosphate enzyme (YggS family)